VLKKYKNQTDIQLKMFKTPTMAYVISKVRCLLDMRCEGGLS